MASSKSSPRPRTSLDPTEIRMIHLTLGFQRGWDLPFTGDLKSDRRLGGAGDLGLLLSGQGSFPDRRLEAVHQFSLEILGTRGRPSVAALRAFLDAGFNRADVLEVIRTVTSQVLAWSASERPLHPAPTPGLETLPPPPAARAR
jgi:hypothetical protein